MGDVMREVPGFRRSCLRVILVAASSLALFFCASPASAQSGSDDNQPTAKVPEKPFDPSSTEATSLHTTVKDEVRRDTPGLTIKPGQMLHTDVDVPLVNVTVTDPYH